MAASPPELPPQVQNQLLKLQELQRQGQMLAAQRQQLDMTARETTKTLEEIGKLEAGATVYRSSGALLMRVKDLAAVKSELDEVKESAEVRLAKVKKEEERLKERLLSLQKELQAVLGGP